MAEVNWDVVGPKGWGVEHQSLESKLLIEGRHYDRIAEDMPCAFRARPARDVSENPLYKKFLKFMEDRKYFPGSMDLTLLDEFAFGRRYHYLFQDIGSCVASNTFRPATRRHLYEILFLGQAEELHGREEFGPKSIAYYAPASYQFARKRANMWGSGDGLYCEPMIESLMKDGLVSCGHPKLLELLGNPASNQLPEPIGNPSLYRAIGDGRWHQELIKLPVTRLMESIAVKDIDVHDNALSQGKLIIQCSMIAIKKSGIDEDGFQVHTRDTSNQWAHNMSFQAKRVTSRGNIYYGLSNESWANNLIYWIRRDEVATWYRNGLTTSMTLGEFDLVDSDQST